MFSVRQILKATNHPEMPEGEIRFHLLVQGDGEWLWSNISNNGDVPYPEVSPHNERRDPR